MAHISTHILDISKGLPAAGIRVALAKMASDQSFYIVGEKVSDEFGRISNLLGDEGLEVSQYRLEFLVDEYFKRFNQQPFFPKVAIYFAVQEIKHHHIPLLLSPYGFSTYRGC